MKRRDVVRAIADEAKKQGRSWELAREGANHTVYQLEGLMIPIPRHREIGERTTRGIFVECEPVLGEGWWK